MLLTKINTDDLNKLNQLRVERFISLFVGSLSKCLLQIESNILFIHCYHGGLMDEVLDDLDELVYYAHLILGTQSISFNLFNEEILHVQNTSW